MGNVVEQVKEMFNKVEEPFTAERAWIETTYGNGSYRSIEKRIKDKQNYIKNIIKGKFDCAVTSSSTSSRAYRCVIDFEEDIKHYINEILQPFVDGGFNVINLSDNIDAIKDENVYLISWKNAFDKTQKVDVEIKNKNFEKDEN